MATLQHIDVISLFNEYKRYYVAVANGKLYANRAPSNTSFVIIKNANNLDQRTIHFRDTIYLKSTTNYRLLTPSRNGGLTCLTDEINPNLELILINPKNESSTEPVKSYDTINLFSVQYNKFVVMDVININCDRSVARTWEKFTIRWVRQYNELEEAKHSIPKSWFSFCRPEEEGDSKINRTWSDVEIAGTIISLTCKQRVAYEKVLHKINQQSSYALLSTQQKETKAACLSIKELLRSSLLNPRVGNGLHIKLSLSEITNEPLLAFVSRVSSWFNTGPKYGFFHPSLTINGITVDWTNSNFCEPREFGATKAVIVLDLLNKSIRDPILIDNMLNAIAEVITDYNINHHYHCATRNCQAFVQDVLKAIDISDPFSGAVQKFFMSLRSQQACNAHITISGSTAKKLAGFVRSASLASKLESIRAGGKIEFATHREVDEFVISMRTVDPSYFDRHPSELQLLKGFCRSFWVINKKVPHASTVEHEQGCPFGNPTRINGSFVGSIRGIM